MNKAVGWIFDAYIQDEGAVIWIRTDENKVLRLTDTYFPSFYIRPRKEDDEVKLFQLLSDSSHIKSIALEKKHIVLDEEKRKKLLHITIDRTLNYNRLVEKIELLYQVDALYNTDLSHIQQYLFTRLEVPPTSKIQIEYDSKKWINSIKLIDDSEEIAPPPFTILLFDIHTNALILSPKSKHDPITVIEVKYKNEEKALQGEEQAILEQFSSMVKTYDPDFLVCHDSINTVNYLFDRIKYLKLDLQLGREEAEIKKLTRPLPYWFRGRVILDYKNFKEYGIAGMVERARFSVLPPGIASRLTANRIIDSRNCYELLKRGYVIPKNVGYYEYIRTVEEVLDHDRGGLILAPKIGVVHENVAELDFESQYPALIVKDGLSYETVTPKGLRKKDNALLPHVTEQFLNRRLYFKRLRREYDENSQKWQWCEQRQLALKMILVCLYGTSGCCWNRFGNVICFEEINSRSRKILVETKNLVQQKGFEVIYADTDSIFVKKDCSTKVDYEALCWEISQHVDLPIEVNHHYKYLLLLPLESDPSENMAAQKHYFGILTSGELLTRGIEARRHDCPIFIKKFQENLIRTLFDAETAEGVYTIGYKNAVNFVVNTINKLMNKETPIEELVVSKILRKPLSEYTRMFPHVSAAVNLIHHGKKVKAGETVNFIFVNAEHHNPLRRVAPIEIFDSEHYDCEKYRDMVLDAAETCLSTFGFSRQKFGLKLIIRTFREALIPELNKEMKN